MIRTTSPRGGVTGAREGSATGGLEDLQGVDRQQEVGATERGGFPRGVGEVVAALRVVEELALGGPALAGDELGLQQVERVRAPWVGDVAGAGEDVEPGHEVVEARVRIRRLRVDGAERPAVGSLQVDPAFEEHLRGGGDGPGERVARGPQA